MANEIVKAQAKACGVKLWQVAEALGMTDSNFSRKLRKELSDKERIRIEGIIADISGRRESNAV